MKFVIATENPGKIKEMRTILKESGLDIVTRDELGITVKIEETGTTFSENAELKAKMICCLSAMPAIADDSGLTVDALNGEPGVYSSSYGGEELDYHERCLFLLKNMEKEEQRQAKFVCTIVCVFPDGDMITATGECLGSIAAEISGTGGFGYDPVFIPEGHDITMAQLSSEEKNKLSHRGKALKEFIDLLNKKSNLPLDCQRE